MKRSNRQTAGFTIIEVLIVLAIAGLIMLVVFLAVPALQKRQRDARRKDAVTHALNVVEQYKADHNGIYPFALNGIPDAATYGKFYDGYIKGTSLEEYTFNILPLNTTDFDYLGPLDELTFTTGHWCNRPDSDMEENLSNHITGDGKNPREVAVWTKLEGGGRVFCLDNSTGKNQDP